MALIIFMKRVLLENVHLVGETGENKKKRMDKQEHFRYLSLPAVILLDYMKLM